MLVVDWWASERYGPVRGCGNKMMLREQLLAPRVVVLYTMRLDRTCRPDQGVYC